MDPSAPILFFNSGVGGLSVLEPTRALLPNAPIVYAADSAGFPYGKRSEAEIASRVPALLGRLVERFHPRLAVIACNTASTIALDHVRSALDLPVVGTVPAIKPAAEMSKSRVIGVLGTEATVRQPYVDDLAARVCCRLHVHPPRLARTRRARRSQARRRGGRRRCGPRGNCSRCSTRQAAIPSTRSFSPARTFPLLERRAARRLPGYRLCRRRRRHRASHCLAHARPGMAATPIAWADRSFTVGSRASPSLTALAQLRHERGSKRCNR